MVSLKVSTKTLYNNKYVFGSKLTEFLLLFCGLEGKILAIIQVLREKHLGLAYKLRYPLNCI